MHRQMLDYLIIGQGLAGSLLAWQLHKCGQRVLVVDNGHQSASSMVAAGLINPVTGKRLVKTVGVDACLPAARDCYREWERLLGETLLVDKPMLRLFNSEAERVRWRERLQDQGYQAYLGDEISSPQLPTPVYSAHGGGWQLQTAYLRMVPLLAGIQDALRDTESYLREEFDYRELVLTAEGARWRDLQARGVIFCEGYIGAQNPWFDWLPFQPAKGEFLTLRCETALPDCIINAGRWLMPRGGDYYRVGASYEHQRLDGQPTSGARQALLAALPTFLDPQPGFEVVGQQAGVRPTTSDRQPFIGRHPNHPQLLIFNGFGSKGALLIPWHVTRLVRYLLAGETLPYGIDIQRYRGSARG